MSPRRPGVEKKRFTLWLPDETVASLTRIQETTGKASVAEVVREAIEVYESLQAARQRDIELLFHDLKTGEKGRIWLLPGPAPVTRKR